VTRSEKEIIEEAKRSLKDELYSAEIYFQISRMFKDSEISRKLVKISKMESSHAALWASFLKRRGVDPGKLKVSRAKIFLWKTLFRVIGLGLTLKILESGERDAIKLYSEMLSSPHLSEEEKRKLREIMKDELVHEDEFASEEKRFQEFISHVRDAVLGMNDGLVEILSVSAGLAGAYGNSLNVALGGLIVGVSGALSMAIGTYVSVKAQKEVRLGIIERVKLASQFVTEVFINRIKKYMSSKGFSESLSGNIADEASKDKELMAKIIAEEEHGLKEEMLDDPRTAGIYTGIFYLMGAFIPLLPYFFMLPITAALPISFIAAGLMLAGAGTIIAITAELSIKRKALELMLAGLGAAAITYGIGVLASILLGIEVG